MPYQVLKDVAMHAENRASEAESHAEGTVVSDWQVPPFIRQKVSQGDPHYRSLLEPLTEDEAFERRAKATKLDGDHFVSGRWISPPWDDYAGLHSAEILARLRTADPEKVEQVRLYELGAETSRDEIVSFAQSDSAPDSQETTTPQALRWSESNPGDAAHIAEIENRLADLERRMAAMEETPRSFVLSSPMAGVIGSEKSSDDAETERNH